MRRIVDAVMKSFDPIPIWLEREKMKEREREREANKPPRRYLYVVLIQS